MFKRETYLRDAHFITAGIGVRSSLGLALCFALYIVIKVEIKVTSPEAEKEKYPQNLIKSLLSC